MPIGGKRTWLRRVRRSVNDAWGRTGWKTTTGIMAAFAVFFAGVAAQQRIDVGRVIHIPTDSTGPNWAEIVMVSMTALLVVAGLWALSAVEEARRARNAQQMTELLRRWDDETNREVRLEIMHLALNGLPLLDHASGPGPDRLKEAIVQLRADNSPAYRRLMTEPGFLEDLAIMVDYGGIDFEIVNLSLGYQIAYRWCLWRPTAVALREVKQAPELYVNFEKLAGEIAKVNPMSVPLDEDGEIRWIGFRD